MADVLAVTNLYDAVVARFLLDGTAITNTFGWREPAKKLVTGPRIAWIPGDESGALGEVGPPKNPGRNPRRLANLAELFTVEITTSDADAPTDERAQYVAARLAFDAWYRAVHLAAYGNFSIVDSEWIVDKKELRHGAALRIVVALNAVIPDAVRTPMPVDTTGVFDLSSLDVTEEIEAVPA